VGANVSGNWRIYENEPEESPMSVTTTAHLNFRGNARQALQFYQSVFGGQLMIATYGEVGVPQDRADAQEARFTPVPAGSADADHVAFGMVASPDGFRLAAYDVFATTGGGTAGARLPDAVRRAEGLTHTESSFLLLNSETLAEATALWDKLSDGATVIQALAPADWAPAYGMLTDRFGVTWIFGVAPA
jgi:PhnB protein